MARKTRKYYKQHSPEAKAKIAAGQARHQQKVREALALLAAQNGGQSCSQ
jgi:hypothetical protein